MFLFIKVFNAAFTSTRHTFLLDRVLLILTLLLSFRTAPAKTNKHIRIKSSVTSTTICNHINKSRWWSRFSNNNPQTRMMYPVCVFVCMISVVAIFACLISKSYNRHIIMWYFCSFVLCLISMCIYVWYQFPMDFACTQNDKQKAARAYFVWMTIECVHHFPKHVHANANIPIITVQKRVCVSPQWMASCVVFECAMSDSVFGVPERYVKMRRHQTIRFGLNTAPTNRTHGKKRGCVQLEYRMVIVPATMMTTMMMIDDDDNERRTRFGAKQTLSVHTLNRFDGSVVSSEFFGISTSLPAPFRCRRGRQWRVLLRRPPPCRSFLRVPFFCVCVPVGQKQQAWDDYFLVHYRRLNWGHDNSATSQLSISIIAIMSHKS